MLVSSLQQICLIFAFREMILSGLFFGEYQRLNDFCSCFVRQLYLTIFNEINLKQKMIFLDMIKIILKTSMDLAPEDLLFEFNRPTSSK